MVIVQLINQNIAEGAYHKFAVSSNSTMWSVKNYGNTQMLGKSVLRKFKLQLIK